MPLHFLKKIKNIFVKRPKQFHKIENVIWQTGKGITTDFELQYVRDLLLKNIQYNAILDNFECKTILDNSLIIYSNDKKRVPEHFKKYLQQYDKLGYNYSLLHLSNERLYHKFSYYKKANHVFRGYYDPRITLGNVTTIPIGFKSGFLNTEHTTPTITERNYIWAFIGHIKSDRKEMHDTLLPITPHFTHLTSKWNAPEQLSVDEIISIYKKTIFVPSPIGWGNPDSFRINEALEWGCIPIVKKYKNIDYFKNVYGEHPLLLVDNWAQAHDKVIELCKDLDKLERYRLEIQEWYAAFKINLQHKIKTILVGEEA